MIYCIHITFGGCFMTKAKETGGTVITISGRGSQQNVKIENTVITVVE